MLPARIEPNENYRFVIDHGNPLCVVLASTELRAADHPVEPLWHREAGDQRSFDALLRWIGVRRARWQEWGRLAEALGREAFYRHMAERMAFEPIGECVASVFQPLEDPRTMLIGEMLHIAKGLVTEQLYVHRFPSPTARARFLEWFHTDDNSGHAQTLIQAAYDNGTGILGEMLDQIAAGPKARGTKASRIRSRKRRVAA